MSYKSLGINPMGESRFIHHSFPICVFCEICGSHLRFSAKKAGVPDALVQEAIGEIREYAEPALRVVETQLPASFPESIHAAVSDRIRERLALFS